MMNAVFKKRFFGDKQVNDQFIKGVSKRKLSFISKRLGFRNNFESDEAELTDKELLEIQLHYQAQRGTEDLPSEDEIIELWDKERSLEKNQQMEMASTVMLNRVFGENFTIVRATDYDDVYNGTDLLFINQDTGKIMFALDTVHLGPAYAGQVESQNPRLADKKRKQIDQLWSGGSTINFGVEITERGLLGAPIEHLPSFYFGLTSQELSGLLDTYLDPNTTTISESERHAALKFLNPCSNKFH